MFRSILLRAAPLVLGVAGAALPAGADHERYDKRPAYSGKHHAAGGLIVYEHPGFRGRGLRVAGAIRNLRPLGMNDQVSSIQVRAGRWEVCEHPDFRGRCEVVTRDDPKTAYIAMNDNITSIRPVGRGYGEARVGYGRHHEAGRLGRERSYPRRGYGSHDRAGPVRLFEHPYGRGRSVTIRGPVYHLREVHANDLVSSVSVRSGAWLVSTDTAFRGRCEVVTGDVARLKRFGLDDTISSIRPATRREVYRYRAGNRGKHPRYAHDRRYGG